MRRSIVLAAVVSCVLQVGVLQVGVLQVGVVAPVSAQVARPPAPEGVPPAGFTPTLVAGGLAAPIAVTALPDGRALVLQKAGLMRVVASGAVLPAAALSLTVCTQSERGLLGVAPDPAFGSNGHLFVYYTRPSAGAPGGCVNRVSRFTMVGNSVSPASEVVLLDNIGSPAGNHNGGDLAVGNDGYLYVAVGDGGSDPRGNSGSGGNNDAAQDLSLLNGKILRVDRTTGAPAPGNPIGGVGTAACRTRGNTPSTPLSWCREIFAWGLRNPWRFAFDPNTGATRFFINDVGQNAREEVNLGIIGANYGWPAREGQCAQGLQTPCAPPAAGLGYTQPITDYSHDTTRLLDGGGEYITGGAFVPNGAWSAAYDGGYVFADGNPGRMFFKPAVGSTNYAVPFATGVAGVSDIEFVMEATGWALYYVQPTNGQLRKIVYNTTPAPLPPDSSAFVPIAPADRVFDSRALGGETGTLRAGTSRLINVVPVQGVHRAALVNISLIRPSSDAFATVWQPRSSRPASANINGPATQVTGNTSIVPIDADGNILLFVSATSHVVIDVMGFFDDTPSNTSRSGRFERVDPIRAADTRSPADGDTNIYTRALDGPDDVVNVPIEGLWGIPSDTSAVAVIVTALSGAVPTSGYLVAVPEGAPSPPTSNVNVNGGGDVRTNLVVVPVGADGSIDLRMRDVTNVVVDVVGSFTDSSAPESVDGMYVSLNPTRVVDTRLSLGFARLAAGGSGSVNSNLVPNDAQAVSQNIVVTRTGGRGFITAYPQGLPAVPLVANGYATGAGQTRSAMAFTALGATGGTSFFVSMPTDVVVDITGYFTPITAN